MNDFEQPIFATKEIRTIENYIQNELRISGYSMMQKAAESVYDTFNQLSNKSRKIMVFCGAGNNGGDGFLFAKIAKINGFKITVVKIGDFANQSELCKKAEKEAAKSGVKIIGQNFESKLEPNIIIIDAILGIGLKNKVRSQQSEAINKINKYRNDHDNSLVMAIDIPSGLCANSGQALGVSIIADYTITFLGLKNGLFLGEGKIYNKKIIFSNLGIDYRKILNQMKACYYKLSTSINRLIPERKIDANKGDFGHALIVGGDYNMGGSIIMAAEAAFRLGAGKVSVLSRKEHFLPLLARLPNVMTYEANNQNDLVNIVKDKTVIAFGPGLGNSNWGQKLFDFFINYNPNIPKIIDADGLNILATKPNNYNLTNAILTPHPKEAARLLGYQTTKKIQDNRDEAIKKLQEKYQATIVLKGNNSLILGKESKLYLCSDGNPALATAGSGDILSGIITGLKANNFSNLMAALIGVNIHAQAADLFVKTNGKNGMIAPDLVQQILKIVN